MTGCIFPMLGHRAALLRLPFFAWFVTFLQHFFLLEYTDEKIVLKPLKLKLLFLFPFFLQKGMPWWKRLYVATTAWQNEQTIYQNGHVFRVHGISK